MASIVLFWFLVPFAGIYLPYFAMKAVLRKYKSLPTRIVGVVASICCSIFLTVATVVCFNKMPFAWHPGYNFAEYIGIGLGLGIGGVFAAFKKQKK
jgi:dolichyl-phosphate-mannose--protein O-mannosyl transferase